MARKLRYDLFSLLEWTAGIAFLCALLAGAGGSTTWTTRFASLPPDDTALEAWLAAKDRTDVGISRGAGSVTLSMKSGLVAMNFNTFSDLPKPPWQELGYGPLQGSGGSIRWTLFSGSPYLWLAGFGLLIGLALVRRRLLTRKKE